MARTILNQNTQIGASLNYTSTGNAGQALQSGALTIQDDLNALRTQVARMLDATMAGNWYDDIPTTADGKQRSIKQLGASLDAIETKTILAASTVQAPISVPAGQNYVILNVGNGETPTQVAAIGPTTLGAVVAQSQYSNGPFACSELKLVTGSNPTTPKNGCTIVDATTKSVIETNNNDIFGLLQFESTGTDGAAFNDTAAGARVKISFVYFDTTANSIVAAPATDIGGKTIRYTYDFRTNYGALSEDAFLSRNFVDSVATADITLTMATSNQGGAGIPVNSDVAWRVQNGINFKVQTGSGGKDLLAISPSAGGNAGVIATDSLALNTTSAVTSLKGASVATAAQAINLGVTAGQIDTNGSLAIKSLGQNPLALTAGSNLTLTDGFEAASTWVSGAIPLASSSNDWSNYKTAFGEVSLLAGVLKAGQMGSHGIYSAVVTSASVPAGATVTGAGAGANLSKAFPNTSATPNPASNIKVFLNGTLLTSPDDYAFVNGTTSSDLTFTFPLRGGTNPDRITLEVFGNPSDVGQ